MSKNRFIAIRNQASDDTLELYFLDVIADTYDWYTGHTSKVQEIIDKVNYYKPSKIKVIIDSEGGDAPTGLAIYNFLKRCDAKVEVEILGLAASIASVIAMAANKGKLKIARNAFVMIHKAEGSCWGTSDDMRRNADLVDLYTSQIVDIYSQRTGKPVEEINTLIENGDYWMAGEEAVAQGFADETFNETPNLQIAARLDANVYKNIPEQIRAQMKPSPEAAETETQSFFKTQLEHMKNFMTEIVNAIRGVKPAEDGKTAITNQIADAVTAPFEKLGEEIEKTIDNKLTEATGEKLVNEISNKVKEEVVNSIDFGKEGPAKSTIETAVKVAVENATKGMSDKITALEKAKSDLEKANSDLETEITNMKGSSSNSNNGGGKDEKPVGGWN